MQYLKQGVDNIVRVGPCASISDGFTLLATLTISGSDYAYLSEHDGTETDIKSNTWAAISGATGWYDLTLTAAQLDTPGRASIMIYDVSLCLPIFQHFMVVPANVYDSLFAANGTDYLQVDVQQWAGASSPDIATQTEIGDEVDTRIDGKFFAAHAEPTGVPAADETLADKIAYLFMALRNKITVNSSTGKKQFFNDSDTAEWEKDLTDDGTTYTESEGNAP